ncbi:MAG: IS3 family transposase [Vulcanimicrobiaceae bacterium]
MARKRPRSYPPEFRQKVVELARAGRRPEELAAEFELAHQTVRNWLKQADLDAGRRHDGLTSAEGEEVYRLRKRVRQLEIERDILFKSRGLVRSRDRFDSPKVFEFVRAHQAVWPVATQCRVLEVSSSGYYAWLKRAPSMRRRSDLLLGGRIETLHRKSRETYGRPRLQADLRDDGIHVSDRRVARLMRERNIHGASRRKGFKTTARDRDARPAPDLVDRHFAASAPDQLWVADITYVPTWGGFLFLAVVLDVFSRRVVGWAMARHLRTELVLDALNMAIYRRKPTNVIHHSDQGCQYTSIAFGKRCEEAGVRPSMGSVGDCYDNAMCESFNATLECELLVKHRFRNQREAALAVFDYIEGFYNPRRRHTSIGNLSPVEFERRMSQAA